jgi:hypothetical protein
MKTLPLISALILISGCTTSPRLIPNDIKHRDSIAEYTNPKQSLFPTRMQSTIDLEIRSSFTESFNRFFYNLTNKSKTITEVLRDQNGRVMMFSEEWHYTARGIDSKWDDRFVFHIFGYPSASKIDGDDSKDFPFYVGHQSRACFSFQRQKYFVSKIPRIINAPRYKSDILPEYRTPSTCY